LCISDIAYSTSFLKSNMKRELDHSLLDLTLEKGGTISKNEIANNFHHVIQLHLSIT